MSEPGQPLAQTVEEFIKITTSMSTERDLNRLLNMVVTSARTLTHSEGGRIYILDNTKRNLYLEICQNERVGGEQQVELGTFRDAGQFRIFGEAVAAIGLGASPGRDMVARGHHEDAHPHLSATVHSSLLVKINLEIIS